jgi:hypothetical protein
MSTTGEFSSVPALPSPDAIRRQLDAILASPSFHGSKRCHQFLKYVVEKSLAGEASALKERSVAIEVFGRQPESDLAEDTIVRVGAREVRKRLAQYYVTPEGGGAEIRIDLPPGSYVPEFKFGNARVEEAPAVIPSPSVPVPWAWPRRYSLPLTAVGIVAIGMAAIVAVKAGANPNATEFQRFWDPVFRDPAPLLVAVAHPIVYHASGRAVRMNEERLPPQDTPLQRAIQLPPNELNGADMVPVYNQYVGFGDMVVATEVVSMVSHGSRPKAVRLRMASGVEFADLRKAPTLLVGAFTNRWTVELQQAWRFRFSYVPGTAVIKDAQDTTGQRQWAVKSKDNGSAPEDFVLVSRIRSPYTGGLVLVAAGLKQFGTEAAGHLLVDPEGLGAILRKLPEGWESKSLQLVLHVRVIENTPAQPDVVAMHVW